VNNHKLKDLIEECIFLASSAADKILTIYQQKDFKVKLKTDNSPVTEADFAAHHTINDGLVKLTPDYPVLSEEATIIPFSQRKAWDRYWLVDPLDGTRDFVARTNSFSVNIALIENHQPILGVIHIPVTNECFYAAKGLGAFKITNKSSAYKIHTRKMTGLPPVVAVSGLRDDTILKECLLKIGKHEIRHIGSSIKSCRVAEGTVDFYPCLGPTSEWDTAAGQCIIEEAGGRMSKLDLELLQYNSKESLTNPWFIAVGDKNYDWKPFLPD